MNLPEVNPYEEQAIDVVVNVFNRAKNKLGIRQNLAQLANSRREFDSKVKVPLQGLVNPLAQTAEKLIADTINRHWNLTPTFSYILRFRGTSKDETACYLYFEAVFSQPCAKYPIPQAIVVVYFRVADKLMEPPENKGFPMMTFRIEGHHSDHDVRYVALTADWLLAVMKMKIKLFERIEKIQLF